MPTYDYKCSDCGHHFEVFQSMKDEKLKKCPNCGKETLSRLIGTGGGLIFKGSGFYLTDYKNTTSQKSAKESKTETKTDDKSKQPEKTGSDKTPSGETKATSVKSGSSKDTSSSGT